MLRRIDVERSAGKAVDVADQVVKLPLEVLGHARQVGDIERHSFVLHPRQRHDQRKLNLFAEGEELRLLQPRDLLLPDAKGHIGIFRGIPGDVFERYFFERSCLFPGTDKLFERDHRIMEGF